MLASSLLPAVQVALVGRLTHALGESAPASRVRTLVVLCAVTLGVLSSLFEVLWLLRDALARSVGGRAEAMVNDAMARLTPERLADADVTTRARAAREASRTAVAGLPGQYILSYRAAITSVTVVAALWSTSPVGALLLVTSCVPLMLLSPWSARINNRAFGQRVLATRRSSFLAEQLAYQRTATELASLGTSDRVAAMANQQVRTMVSIDLRAKGQTTLINLLGTAISAVIMGFALWLVVTGATNPASGAAAGVVAILSASESISTAGYAFSQLVADSGPAASFHRFLDETPAQSAPREQPLPATLLEATSLCYGYPNATRLAVDNASLHVARGQTIALVGANGAGKTTLVSLLLGILAPVHGQVTVDGTPLVELSEGQRLATFSLLTQEFGRYELTIREAVGLGSPSEDITDDELWAALAFARADGFVRALPRGLDTQLGQQWDGVGLSGGQWQRIALARVALRNAPIWLLDEPTSAVDAETEAQIFDDLVATKHTRITIVVSHRASTLRHLDRIYVIDEGRIVESGSYAELLGAGGRFAQLFADEGAVS